MKKSLLVLTALVAGFFCAQAQNIGYINTETILGQIPEYQAAQQQLSDQADNYKATLESELAAIETLYNNYQARKSNMTSSQRTQTENEIISKERVVKEKQKIYFGEDGVMAKKSEELLTPIKNRVQRAIDAVAKKNGCAIVIDLAVTAGIVYKDSRCDYTQEVINMLK